MEKIPQNTKVLTRQNTTYLVTSYDRMYECRCYFKSNLGDAGDTVNFMTAYYVVFSCQEPIIRVLCTKTLSEKLRILLFRIRRQEGVEVDFNVYVEYRFSYIS